MNVMNVIVIVQVNYGQILSFLDFSFRVSPQDFKMRPLKRVFHTLIKNVLVK